MVQDGRSDRVNSCTTENYKVLWLQGRRRPAADVPRLRAGAASDLPPPEEAGRTPVAVPLVEAGRSRVEGRGGFGLPARHVLQGKRAWHGSSKLQVFVDWPASASGTAMDWLYDTRSYGLKIR